MRRYKNEQGITSTKFEQEVIIRCTLGGNFNKTKVEVELEHGDWYLDFDDIRDYFNDLYGKEFSQEELIAEVYDTMWREYEPKTLIVRAIETTHPASVIERKSF